MNPRIKEWIVERWWDIVDVYDRSEQFFRELLCKIHGHNWLMYGQATDLEPRYWCDKCGKDLDL